MPKILESERFDIVLAETGYDQGEVYALRYGLQVETFELLVDGVRAFESALKHAMTCEGYLPPEPDEDWQD